MYKSSGTVGRLGTNYAASATQLNLQFPSDQPTVNNDWYKLPYILGTINIDYDEVKVGLFVICDVVYVELRKGCCWLPRIHRSSGSN